MEVNGHGEEFGFDLNFIFFIRQVSYWYENGVDVADPSTFDSEIWKHLETLPSPTARRKHCRYLLLRQQKNAEAQKIKDIQRVEGLKKRAEIIEERKQNTHIRYGLGGNTLLPRILPKTLDKWRNRKSVLQLIFHNLFGSSFELFAFSSISHRLMRASLFGQKMIFDCSFDETMSHIELKSNGRQLHYCFAWNRRQKKPFDFHLCNMNMSIHEGTMHWLQKHIPTVSQTKFPLTIHEKCFTELFPRERLIYLSPDSEHDLIEYDGDDIFVVGAIVDKGPCQKLSLAKAKSLGLRHARLPFERHVRFTPGANKRLTLVTLTKVLSNWKETRDWKKAFEHLRPDRLAGPIK